MTRWMPLKLVERRLTKWHWLVRYVERIKIGQRVDIGAFCYLQAEEGIVIEDDVQIGSHCSIYTRSTIDNTKGMIILRRGCRIGSHTVILPDVTIGAGTVVGACSLVKHDLPAGVVAWGTPVTIQRKVA